MLWKHSSVQHSEWGVTITWSIASSGLSGAIGSCSNTSSAAPAIRRARNASISAASSTMGPRATLMKYAVGRIRANCGAPTRWRVSSLSRQQTATKSAAASSVSRSTLRAPR